MPVFVSLFFLLWSGLIGLGWILFNRDGTSAVLRARAWPVWCATGGAMFIALLWTADSSPVWRPMFIIGVVGYLGGYMRRTRFCPHCGSFQSGDGFFDRPRICDACHQDMDG